MQYKCETCVIILKLILIRNLCYVIHYYAHLYGTIKLAIFFHCIWQFVFRFFLPDTNYLSAARHLKSFNLIYVYHCRSVSLSISLSFLVSATLFRAIHHLYGSYDFHRHCIWNDFTISGQWQQLTIPSNICIAKFILFITRSY